MKTQVVLALTLLSAISAVNGFGSGAPEGVCASMTPGHHVDPSTDPIPYKIVLSKNVAKGAETVDITITSKSGERDFKGFIIQVRKPGEEKAYGEFKEFDDESGQTLNCFGTENSAVTHASNDKKKSITAEWIAPNEDAVYEVLFTIVGEHYGEFWTPQTHGEKITVTKDPKAQIATQRSQRSQFTVYK
ncbi:unnamed protein product [Orchesella dallaii]|uniref:Reelin domain-containing protein n=1 Tax=Orchesella dallaii TaxID=48710 RepID=A0ABP1RR29_9HEXA